MEKRTRDDPLPKQPPEILDHYVMPELAEHVQAIDEMVASWTEHRDRFHSELLQYKDIDRAFDNLDVLQEILENIIAMLTRTGKRGKPGGGQVEDWRSNRSFIQSKHTISKQAREIKDARKALEFKTLIQALKRCERSIGTLRNNLAATMEEGLDVSKKLVEDVEVETESDQADIVHPSISDEDIGGEVYVDTPQEENPPEEADARMGELEGIERPYYTIINDWEEDQSLVSRGRATAPINLKAFPSLMEGSETEIGVDTARYGEDQTVITVIQGDHLVDQESHPRLSITETCGLVVQAIEKWDASIVKIETTGGLGAGVYDMLKDLGVSERVRIIALEVQGAPTSRGVRLKAYNLRAELYLNMEERMRLGDLTLLPDPELWDDIAHIRYKVTGNGKIQILDKGEIKKQLGRSPDKADSAAIAAWIAPVPTLWV